MASVNYVLLLAFAVTLATSMSLMSEEKYREREKRDLFIGGLALVGSGKGAKLNLSASVDEIHRNKPSRTENGETNESPEPEDDSPGADEDD